MKPAVRPLLFGIEEAIPLKAAANIAGKTDETIRRWCVKYGIGRQAGPNAPIEVSIIGLMMVIHGEFDTLELLRAGDRQHPAVKRFLNFVGLAA